MHLPYFFRPTGLAALVAVLFAGSLSAAPVVDGDDPIARVTAADGTLTWTPLRAFARLVLVIQTPDDREITREYVPGEVPSIRVLGNEQGLLPDGDYTYRLVLVEPGTEVAEGERVSALVQEGPFTITGFEVARPEGAMDQVIADDLIVQLSLCTGFDCVNGENFGADTIRLKENNLRIHFDDTSTAAGFPSNDWRIVANDQASGGANYLAYEDATAGTQPFRVDAGAGNDAVHVAQGGNIGFGTPTPSLDVHIRDNDTPAIRLEQDNSGGWTPQTWDVASNEANFFVRDVTNGSLLPFRIQPGAPTNSIYVASSGNVGIGTMTPAEQLHATGIAQFDGGLRTKGPWVLNGDLTGQPFAMRVRDLGSSKVLMMLNLSGNLQISGTLNQGSSEAIKDHFQAVDNQSILDRLAAMPLWTWQYRTDEEGVRHLGPTSQDFKAAFGLGADDEHIATVDADGVAMAAIQALHAQVQMLKAQLEERDAQIERLTEQHEAHDVRLARLEALLRRDGYTATSQDSSTH